MQQEFVEGWNIEQILGEGAYGEVRLLVNRHTKEAIAMKVINLGQHSNAHEAVRKEIFIHRRMRNTNIIRYWGHRRENNIEYMFLEYASGGELFDRIEPDMGMMRHQAKRFFKQLISGVKYIHDMGIAHRDLKPENILLDATDNLKISDFGLATVYRHQGRVRTLDTRCGTIPYVAPEVLQKSYRGEVADTWSCGVILIAMLAGELPWDQASVESSGYCAWIEIVNRKEGHDHFSYPPWCKFQDNKALFDLIEKILCPDLSQRLLIHDIQDHPWLLDEPEQIEISTPDRKRQRLNLISLSQPEPRTSNLSPRNNFEATDFGNFSLSQPTELDDLLVSSQLIFTPSAQPASPATKTQNLVKRMTRFFVLLTYSESLTRLCNILDNEGCTWKLNANTLTITGITKLKIQLIFKANFIPMDSKTLVDFRLSRGCGLEFKRHFVRIREHLENVIEHVGPTL